MRLRESLLDRRSAPGEGAPTGSPPTETPGERGVSLFAPVVWRDAALLWALQRALLLAITYFGVTLAATNSQPQAAIRISWAALFEPWLGWDASNYSFIATHGYQLPWTAAFLPLLPALEHALAPLTGGNTGVAGALVANLACLGAFGLLRALGERELGRAVARRTLLYLAFFPTAFFLAAPYTEPLYLLFSVGAFVALRRERWLLAGGCAALAALTRAPGVLLVAPFAVELALRWRAGGRPSLWTALRMLAGLAAPLVAYAGFTLYLHARFGLWNAATVAQESYWGRGFGPPLIGFARAGAALLRYGPDPNFFQARILLDGAFTLLFIALTVATWRRLPLSYVVYAWALLALTLITPQHNWYALASNMRFLLVSFPLFFLLGRWGGRRSVELGYLLAALPLLALLLVTFLSRKWVA